MAGERGWMTAAEAIARLGVKPQTLYAYVSRGQLRREPVAGTRRSRYLREDVERLAVRARPVTRAGELDVVVDTGLTQLDPRGTLTYRGWDVVEASRTVGFETVAEWLWLGRRDDDARWRAPSEAGRAASAVQEALAPTTRGAERFRIAIAAAATADLLRHDRRPEAVADRGRWMITAALDALPVRAVSDAPDHAGRSIATRAWPRLTARPPSPDLIGVLDAALVLLADHELAASALAARVAASTWADPYAAVGAGLSALSGPLHGGASEAVRGIVRRVVDGEPALAVVGERMRDEDGFAGFGHRVYEVPDPRGVELLRRMRDVAMAPDVLDAADAILAAVVDTGRGHLNVDFALGVMAEAYELREGAETVFALARSAGLVGHTIEEYAHRLRYRPRAAYVGPLPGPPPEHQPA